MKVTYKLCKKLLKLNKLTAEMLDIYYAAMRITKEQYLELVDILNNK